MNRCKLINKESFSTTLRTLRKKYQVSHKELGQYVGISPRMIGYYEKEKVTPNLKTALRIVRFFNINFQLNYDFGYWNSKKRINEKGSVKKEESYKRKRQEIYVPKETYSIENKLLDGYETDALYEKNQLQNIVRAYKTNYDY